MTEAVRALPPRREGERAIQEDFERFDRMNPDVRQTLARLANQFYASTGVWPGISMLWERMRWELALATRTPDVYKLNNNYRSRYARLLMDRGDVPVGAFETRQLRAA